MGALARLHLAMARSPVSCEANFAKTASFSGSLCLALYWACS